jgi:hypothetical protein
MKKKSVVKNYIYNLIYQILVILVPVITTPYLSRILGAENIGIYSYTISITTYFVLFGSLGIATYGQREIAYHSNNEEKRTKTFVEIISLRIIFLIISLVVFYFSFCLDGKYHNYYKILIFEIIANSIDISWFFQGIEEFKKIIVRNVFIKLIGVISIFVLIKTSEDLSIYYMIYVGANLLGNMSLWGYILKYTKIKKIKLKELNIRRHIKPTISLFIPQVAIQIYTVLDKTMIGMMVEDKREVGYYEQAQKIMKLLLAIVTSLRCCYEFKNS